MTIARIIKNILAKFSWKSFLKVLPAHIIIFLSQVCLSTIAVFCKQAMEEMDPLIIQTLRSWGGVPFFLVFSLISEKGESSLRQSLKEKAFLKAMGMGFLFTSFQLAFLYGLRMTTPVNAGALFLAVPVWTSAIAMIFLNEPKGLVKILGVVITLGGALTLIKLEEFSVAGGSWIGDLVVVGSALLFALGLIFTDVIVLQTKMGTWTFTFWMFLSASLICSFSIPVLFDDYVKPVFLGVGIAVFIGTAAAFGLMNWAIPRLSPLVASAYIPIELISVVVLATLFLGDSFTLRQGIGSVVVLVGVGMVVYAKQNDAKSPDNEDDVDSDEESLISNRIATYTHQENDEEAVVDLETSSSADTSSML